MKEWKCILLYSQRGMDPLDSSGKKEIDTINIIIIFLLVASLSLSLSLLLEPSSSNGRGIQPLTKAT